LIVPIQNRIQSFGNAIKRVIPFLSHPNESISREALALMKVLLFSGNEDVQEGLINCVQETREETLFLRLKSRLEQTGITYKETLVHITALNVVNSL
jgi:inositol 1,4,5-triphosphate receptor type 1